LQPWRWARRSSISLLRESIFSTFSEKRIRLYAVFFVLAGAHLQVSALLLIGLSGIGYTVARIIGKMAGAWYGTSRLGYPPVVESYLGLTLIAHAGVAIGLTLQIRSLFSNLVDVVSTVILGSVLINEVIGPVLTKFAISRAGEVREEHPGAFETIWACSRRSAYTWGTFDLNPTPRERLRSTFFDMNEGP
jgi:hypothetical protein